MMRAGRHIMELNNRIMLITYADSLGGDLKSLARLLRTRLKGAVGGVHILPFFPSSADRGFAPMRYDEVDPAFGTYDDISALSDSFYLMFDFMVNHISRQSEYYKDFALRGDASPYRDFFIRYKDFWPGGEPTREQVDLIYKRKPRAPYTVINFADGTSEKLWCTFGEEQVDLNVASPVTKEFISGTVRDMCAHGASVIRLDAFAYAVKKPGTSCFFVEPDIWRLLDGIADVVRPYGATILPEIHEHYTIPLGLARRGYWIYDFALPVLTLYALYSGDGAPLKRWLDMSPRRQFTTLDTHDGIGIVDVKDLLTDEQTEFTKEKMFTKGANVKKIYNTAAYNNLDIYQVNTTYYSALGDDDRAYLLARAIQFFAPGIPQVYYVGLLAGKNDVALMERTKNGRDINRHYYSEDEALGELGRPVVRRLLELMELRNESPAFDLASEIKITLSGEHGLTVERSHAGHTAALRADLLTHDFAVEADGRKIDTSL
jgi:sucrose phosphorylase